MYHKLNDWKKDLWDKAHIGVPSGDTEANDAVVLGYLVSQFIAEVRFLGF